MTEDQSEELDRTLSRLDDDAKKALLEELDNISKEMINLFTPENRSKKEVHKEFLITFSLTMMKLIGRDSGIDLVLSAYPFGIIPSFLNEDDKKEIEILLRDSFEES